MSIRRNAQTSGAESRIAGLGAPFGSDDGVGLELVAALAQDPAYAARCVLLADSDAATVASALLEWDSPVLVVDAADMRLAPGEHRFFSDHDACIMIKNSSVSTHGLGLAEGLGIARALGFDRPVRIFGVQPYNLAPGRGLSPEMAARFPALLGALHGHAAADVLP